MTTVPMATHREPLASRCWTCPARALASRPSDGLASPARARNVTVYIPSGICRTRSTSDDHPSPRWRTQTGRRVRVLYEHDEERVDETHNLSEDAVTDEQTTDWVTFLDLLVQTSGRGSTVRGSLVSFQDERDHVEYRFGRGTPWPRHRPFSSSASRRGRTPSSSSSSSLRDRRPRPPKTQGRRPITSRSLQTCLTHRFPSQFLTQWTRNA